MREAVAQALKVSGDSCGPNPAQARQDADTPEYLEPVSSPACLKLSKGKTMKWVDRTARQKAEVVEFYARQGKTSYQIANLTGAPSRGAVMGVVHRNGIALLRSAGPKTKMVPFKPPVTPTEPALSVRSVRVPFLERERNECAWIVNDDTKNAICCGNPVKPDFSQPYCPAHAEISTADYVAYGYRA